MMRIVTALLLLLLCLALAGCDQNDLKEIALPKAQAADLDSKPTLEELEELRAYLVSLYGPLHQLNDNGLAWHVTNEYEDYQAWPLKPIVAVERLGFLVDRYIEEHFPDCPKCE